MKSFITNWLPLIVCCTLLAAGNHLSNGQRIDEYRRLEAKLDGAVEFIGASWGPADEGSN